MQDTIYATGLELWRRWTEMWNSKPELALELVAPRFVLHLIQPAQIDETTVCDPATTAAWVANHRAKFDQLTFHTGVGPFVDTRASVVAGPWHAETIMNGVSAQVCGMDTIAFRDGKITEYWTMSKPTENLGRWSQGLSTLTT